MTLWSLVLGSWLLFSFLLALAAWVGRTIDRPAIGSAVWAMGFTLNAPLLVVFGPGYGPRKLLLGTLFVLGGLRWGVRWARQVFTTPGAEAAWLNARLRVRTGLGTFALLQIAAVIGVLFLAPLLIAIQNDAPELHAFELVGAFVGVCGLIASLLTQPLGTALFVLGCVIFALVSFL